MRHCCRFSTVSHVSHRAGRVQDGQPQAAHCRSAGRACRPHHDGPRKHAADYGARLRRSPQVHSLAYRNDLVRHILAALLLREGYPVTCCDDGDAAPRYLRSAQAELVITGMLMPNMDGLELIRCLRGHPPIIALAEEADQMSPIYLRYAGLAGAASTHTVPIGRETFFGEIDHILDGGKNAIRNVV
jgi:CheY-like chemotaxis protein